MTDSGLVIVALADGSVVARDDGVRGLGAAYLAARTAYAYDPAGRRVLAMNAAGEVLAIGLDQTAAVRVDAPTAAVWSTRLSAEPSTAAPSDPTAAEAALGPERIVLRDLPFGVPGSVLVRVTPDGLGIAVGGSAFHGAQLVVDGGTAVGAGHVLVEHRRSVNDADATLSAVSLVTGQVTGTLAIQSGVERAVLGPHGTTAVAAREVFAVLHGDGRVVRLDIGAADFFGTPS